MCSCLPGTNIFGIRIYNGVTDHFHEREAEMNLIVQKFGGSSVCDARHIMNVASIIAETYRAGNQVIAVLSAQGNTTDDLIEKAKELNPRPSGREQDMLLSAGEQISVALCAMALESMGLPAVSLTAWQAGIHTTDEHSAAHIKTIDSKRIREELEKQKIVLVAGFQGVNTANDITTLGRGGSDTSAVALAAAFGAEVCQIYTDVAGVYTSDPRIVPTARMLSDITYDEMLELSNLGAQVLHNRSVELSKKHHVNLEVLSSLDRRPGTRVKQCPGTEKRGIAGAAIDLSVVLVTLSGGDHFADTYSQVLSLLNQHSIQIDAVFSYPTEDNKEFSFTLPEGNLEDAVRILQSEQENIGYNSIMTDRQISKVSIVGAAITAIPDAAAQMTDSLRNANIPVRMVITDTIHISAIIDRKHSAEALRAVHDKFIS